MTQNAPSPASTDKPNYKKTLALPSTSFAMKANLVQSEPASMKRWDEIGLYAMTRAARKGAPRFVFHDGPPYANGSIHLGHLLNKTLKDLVVRARTMAGMDCPYVPGWDCHGLPIEHKVMTEMVESGKWAKLTSLEEDTRRMAVRKACQAYAEKYIKLQAKEMKRLLTIADYDDPYLTMKPAYEGAVLEVFADLIEQGLVYRDLKPVHWSVANETALAEAELEYYDREDPSIYVEFEALDRAAVAKAFGLDPDDLERTPTFMIWTTTPWTLPANLGVAVHPKVAYALVEMDGSITVVAADLLEGVAKRSGTEKVRTLATTTGDRLTGLAYRHPFMDGAALGARLKAKSALHRVVGAEYVSVEDGTGLVHTAPGHGSEDFQTGQREELPIYCPVRGNGTYDDTVPEWLRGKSIWDANAEIVEHLRASGHMFFDHVFTHSYPHDWRGKSPVIFRATEQWFISVEEPTRRDRSALRNMALESTARDVEFVPEWGRNRMRGMLESRPDWCISRQRAWGLPIPAFFAPDGRTLLTAASVRAVAKVVREKGSDAWFTETPAALLHHYDVSADKDAPKGLDVGSLVKSRDIFDVWFESGCSWNAVMRERKQSHTDEKAHTDLYLEGSDQHRGWFQVSLLTSLGATGRPPYRTLLTHGFIVDKHGGKMSKSLGNTIEVEDLLRDFGADVCRWWVATLSYENDIKADKSFFETAGEAYRKVRNTLRFMLSNLADFEPARTPGADGGAPGATSFPPTSVDAWVLGEHDRLAADVLSAYERYDFRAASTRIYDFCNETLSAVYLAAIKDRLYCDPLDTPRRRRTQAALWAMTDSLCRMLAPILPHTADEAYRALLRTDEAGVTVHTKTIIRSLGAGADEAWPKAMAARAAGLLALEKIRASKGVENPLDAGVVLADPDGALGRFDPVDLADLMGVSRVTLERGAGGASVMDLRMEPRCERSWKRDGTVRLRSDGGMLSERDAKAVGVA